tara:strand:- start:361 stop:642 length:282 start_codon:yes stop_codon:yes gene_type:complete
VIIFLPVALFMFLFLDDCRYCLRRYSFAATRKTETFRRRGLYRYERDVNAKQIGNSCSHGVAVRADLRCFADNRQIDIADTITGFPNKLGRVF